MKKISSTEFLLMSECVNQTVQGMFGNAPRPEPVREIKQIERDLSVGFGPRKEYAAAVLRADALQGTLPVYVRARPAARQSSVDPERVPPELLNRLLPVRGGLPDHPTHVRRIRTPDSAPDDATLLLVRHGQLVVRRADFIDWYKHKRDESSWPSQSNKVAPRRGRPMKDVESLRNAILALVQMARGRPPMECPNFGAS